MKKIGTGPTTLRAIIADLEDNYCQSIGIEFTYMREPDSIAWFKNHIELKNRPKYDAAKKKEIYRKLAITAGFESFLGKKFVGQKRFSVEGLEVLVPALDALVKKEQTMVLSNS